MGGDGVAMAEERRPRHHHAVAEATEMGLVLHLLGEDVGSVDCARDMGDGNGAVGVNLPNLVFAKVDVFDALVRDGGGPVDSALVVVVDGRGTLDVGHAEVGGAVAEVDELADALVCRDDFGLARAEGRLVLADGLPGDGAATAADDEAAEGAVLEEFEGSAIGDRVAELAAPARVAEGGKAMAVGGGGGGGVLVGLLVMVVWKVVESLEGVGGIAVE